jgi:hypothetical protein
MESPIGIIGNIEPLRAQVMEYDYLNLFVHLIILDIIFLFFGYQSFLFRKSRCYIQTEKAGYTERLMTSVFCL